MSLGAGAIAGYSVLGAFGGYILTSVLLLKCPGIVHKKKKQHFHVAHISHRGGAAERLENTLSAFHHAVEEGSQMLELDVYFSKDKKIVVSHDGDLKRTTGVEANICDVNYEELPILKNSLQVTFYGSTMCHNKDKPEKMPTLDEVFEAFPNTPINLDVKGDDEELMEKTCELIQAYNRETITVWGNFKDSTCKKLYKLNPNVPIFFSLRRVMLLYVWFYFGLLPFIPLKETHLEIVLPDIVNSVDFTLSRSRRIILNVFGFFIKSSVLFAHLKERGIPTYLWVLNEEKDFQVAFKLGAEGVMTDSPTKLTSWLQENPKYWGASKSGLLN